MLQRYFASYFSQYFGKTNMLSYHFDDKRHATQGNVMAIFSHFQSAGVQDFGSCGF